MVNLLLTVVELSNFINQRKHLMERCTQKPGPEVHDDGLGLVLAHLVPVHLGRAVQFNHCSTKMPGGKAKWKIPNQSGVETTFEPSLSKEIWGR